MGLMSLPRVHSAAAESGAPAVAVAPDKLPLTVRDAAAYRGVSVQTVYFRLANADCPSSVMVRDIRLLKSDLEPFRAAFKQRVGRGRT
jgi:hypothetical protein